MRQHHPLLSLPLPRTLSLPPSPRPPPPLSLSLSLSLSFSLFYRDGQVFRGSTPCSPLRSERRRHCNDWLSSPLTPSLRQAPVRCCMTLLAAFLVALCSQTVPVTLPFVDPVAVEPATLACQWLSVIHWQVDGSAGVRRLSIESRLAATGRSSFLVCFVEPLTLPSYGRHP